MDLKSILTTQPISSLPIKIGDYSMNLSKIYHQLQIPLPDEAVSEVQSRILGGPPKPTVDYISAILSSRILGCLPAISASDSFAFVVEDIVGAGGAEN